VHAPSRISLRSIRAGPACCAYGPESIALRTLGSSAYWGRPGKPSLRRLSTRLPHFWRRLPGFCCDARGAVLLLKRPPPRARTRVTFAARTSSARPRRAPDAAAYVKPYVKPIFERNGERAPGRPSGGPVTSPWRRGRGRSNRRQPPWLPPRSRGASAAGPPPAPSNFLRSFFPRHGG
jgi:hypothetical protein